LAAIVAEFRFNWSLVADVLRGATSMSGNYRRPDMCKIRSGGRSGGEVDQGRRFIG
jgi:hypothetical protein